MPQNDPQSPNFAHPDSDPTGPMYTIPPAACGPPVGGRSGSAGQGSGTPEVPGYMVIRRLDRGGMGEVWEAHHPRHGYVAIKLIRRDRVNDETRGRFEVEEALVSALDHKAIIGVIDRGECERDGSREQYFVMRLIRGAETLAQHCWKLPVRGRLELFRRVLAAVRYAHERKVVHRDLKPGNILVDKDGDPYIIDFGLAILRDPDPRLVIVEAGQVVGTLRYMSPEQCAGDPLGLDHRCDIYSLGAILYECLTARYPYPVPARPFAAALYAVRHAETEPPPRGTMPGRALWRVVHRAMSKERMDRFQSVEDFQDALAAVLKSRRFRAECAAWAATAAARRAGGRLSSSAARAGGAVLNPVAAACAWAAARWRHAAAAAVAALLIVLALVTLALAAPRVETAFERALAALPIDRSLRGFDDVHVVTFDRATPFTGAGAGFDPASPESARLAFAEVIDTLAAAAPSVIACDARFSSPCDGADAQLAAAAGRARAANVEVVVALERFRVGSQADGQGAAGAAPEQPWLTPALRPVTRRGCARAWQAAGWQVPVAAGRDDGPVEPAFALCVCLAHRRQDANAAVVLDAVANSMTAPIAAGGKASEMSLYTVAPAGQDEPGCGLEVGDLVGVVYAPPPSPATLAGATTRYADLVAMTPTARQKLLGGRVVFVACTDSDGTIIARDGAPVPAVYASAVAAQSLLSTPAVVSLPRVATRALVLLGSALGAAAAFMRPARGAATIIAAAAAMVAVSVAVYLTSSISLDPFIPIASTLIAAGAVACVRWLPRLPGLRARTADRPGRPVHPGKGGATMEVS